MKWASLAALIFDRLLFKATVGTLVSLKVKGGLFLGSEFAMLEFFEIGTHILNLGLVLLDRLGKLSHRTWLNFNNLLLRFPWSLTRAMRSV